MKKKKRDFDIFNLSFLDIISCGFGAVVLLVLISKTDISPIEDIEGDAKALLEQVLSLESTNSVLNDELLAAEDAAASKRLLLGRLESLSTDADQQKQTVEQQISQLEDDVAGLEAVQESLERLKTSNLTTRTTEVRDDEVGGIPVDSDYVIFIVDTSGSMLEIWDRVTKEVENIINIHPKIKGFQILNDNGTHILSAYEGKWIPDTPQRRSSVIKLFRTWKSASNSSPVEGLEVALKRYVNPNTKVSIYIFGDDYSGSSYDPVINALSNLNTNKITGAPLARVHGVGFISNYTTGRYAILMREVARRNNGTFIALSR
ncbi:hypothetical protein N9L49_03885 [Rhodospirillales bacterium]|nr:hypothetical protein [Rhodospirillales bacterium]